MTRSNFYFARGAELQPAGETSTRLPTFDAFQAVLKTKNRKAMLPRVVAGPNFFDQMTTWGGCGSTPPRTAAARLLPGIVDGLCYA